MLERGVYLAPSQFEAGFMSSAHGDQEIDRTLDAAKAAFAEEIGLIGGAYLNCSAGILPALYRY